MQAASSSSSTSKEYTEVYIWLGKDEEGYTTNSFGGGVLDQKRKGNARCGHVAMQIFTASQNPTYISLWPKNDEEGNLKAMSEFCPSLEEEQGPTREKSLPDVIIRLHHLDIPKMLAKFNELKDPKRLDQIWWRINVDSYEDVCDNNCTVANCATFVYSLLKLGGLGIQNNPYKQCVHESGPQDPSLYEKTKCHVGALFGGFFDNWFWTNWNITPKKILLRVASAAEAHADDRAETIKIMNSSRVAVERGDYSLHDTVNTSIAASAAATSVGILGYALQKK